jgi:release factor glutamine methyltransferase
MPLPTIQQALQQAVEQLSMHESARLDAEVLLARVLDKPRSHLHAWPDKQLDQEQVQVFRDWVNRRAKGEPVAYLTGEREFWSLPLEVTPDTLIPRPDTEILVERTLQLLPADQALIVADLGTGSGAIALALAQERPHWTVYALDRAPACIRVAKRNARRTQAGKPVFIIGDWCAAFADNSLDAIISNPPYVEAEDPHLQRGDVRFEPLTALASGDDGLDAIRLLTRDAGRVLKDAGHLLLEHAPQQTGRIHKLLKEKGFNSISTARDLAGLERVSSARKSR